MPTLFDGLSRRRTLAFGLAAPLARTRSAHAAPLAIADALGRTVSLKAPAERIVRADPPPREPP